ncbi:MAG: hypothetical protein JXA01_00540 [Dehalococcoidia bacterium]|nr:hypothetical protein [Dehalococcoidia bacterium]
MSKQKSLSGLVAAVMICLAVIFSPITASADSSLDGLSLTVTTDVQSASLGETITYTYVITSTCNTTVSELELTDDRLGIIGLTSSSLEPGENITVSAAYTVGEADFPGPLTGSAGIAGVTESGDSLTASATSMVTLNPLTSSIEVSMSADKASASVGDTVTYTYTVVNTGEAELSGISLSDSRLGTIALTSDSLAAQGSLTATAVYVVVADDLPGPLVSSAAVEGQAPDAVTVSGSSAEVPVTLAYEDDHSDNSTMTKAQILRQKGVPGKGIDKAPGLQKSFNLNSQAANHAGGKNTGKGHANKNNGKHGKNGNGNNMED